MPMDAAAWAAALEASSLATAIRAGAWAYPVCNVAHVLGVGLLLGAVLLADLRVLGVARAIPLHAVLRLCNPLIRLGLVLLLPSGVLLFAADAVALWPNPVFRIKLVLVAIGLLNGLAFQFMAGRTDEAGPSLRMQAALSLAAWPIVTAAGRLIAYV